MSKHNKNRFVKKRKRPQARPKKDTAAQHSSVGPLTNHWPILPLPSIAKAMSVLSQMHFIEKMPPGQQNRHQLRQIERVLRHAYDTVPYYRDKLTGIEHIPDGGLDETFFSAIPILTRSDIQTATTTLHSTRIPPEHGSVQIQRSSGSTGKPIEILTTALRKIIGMAHPLRAHYWHRRDVTRKNVNIRTAQQSGVKATPSRWSALPWSGPSQLLDINLPISELFEQFIAEDPSYVFSHPYTLMLLAERSRETGVLPRNLVEARSFGEAVSANVRQTLREVWNAPVIDTYSAGEIGIIAHQCPNNENLHVQVENVRVEILDPAGEPCKPGMIGRVVITTLHNFATPLIRYEIGDYAEVGEPCSCGRTLPVLSRILGRHRNLCVLKNGERFFPEIQSDLKKFDHIRQFQAHQKTLDDIDLKIVAVRPFTDAEKDEVQAIVQKKFHYPFNVNIIEVDDIPRAANGKFEEFKSDLPEAMIDQ
ncbi:phenylacetate--CoA ligase family protein [Pseudomonadota bacterium]